MVGNHRDAWGFGGMDPSSGTASMLEVARVLGEKLKTGWRPRRTIIFLSWGSEEFGLIGIFKECLIKKFPRPNLAFDKKPTNFARSLQNLVKMILLLNN